MPLVLANLFAIYKKEVQGYFTSPLAYLIAGVFWIISGIFFVVILQNLLSQLAQFDLQQAQFGGPGNPIDAASLLLQNFLGSLGVVVIVVMPMLSMGLYAEERKRGTLELLATSPVTNWAVAVGKLLGVLTFFLGMLLPIMLYEAIALSATEPPFPPVLFLMSHVGLLLMAASILSLGMFISSLTDSTLLSAIFTFVLVLILWIFQGIGNTAGGALGEVASHLSLLKHYDNFVNGVLDVSSLILFLTYIILGVFLTAQSIETFRFQRN
ncbi:MAG: ABC transporter permease [Prochlorotrichaceae cyanobacterium]